MDINLLVKLTSRAWSLNILSLMHSGTPGRQAALLSASGASRTTFTNSLNHLVELGLVIRNPGHGHPLRPEYILTPLGKRCAIHAEKINQAAVKEDELALLRKTWTVPILAVSLKPRYFSEIKKDLNGITDRALSTSLKILHAQKWITREIDVDMRPPRPLYRAANAGIQISQAWM